jgi:hypothetical protein
MYFSHRHRHKHFHLEPSNNDLCLICLEDNVVAPFIRFKELYQYPTKCKCNGIYHLHCVNIWISIYNSCPICRSLIINNHVPFGLSEIQIFLLKIMRILLILYYFFFQIYIIHMLVNYILLQLL